MLQTCARMTVAYFPGEVCKHGQISGCDCRQLYMLLHLMGGTVNDR